MEDILNNYKWSALRFEHERHVPNTPVIVIEQHVFSLVVDLHSKPYIPCRRCAFNTMCRNYREDYWLKILCMKCTPRGAGYWVADRYPSNLRIEDIKDAQAFPDKFSKQFGKMFDKPLYDAKDEE